MEPLESGQMAIGLEKGVFTGGILGILVKWPLDMKMEVSQVEPLELGVKWLFDLQRELSQVESVEF